VCAVCVVCVPGGVVVRPWAHNTSAENVSVVVQIHFSYTIPSSVRVSQWLQEFAQAPGTLALAFCMCVYV
jgi:hypothetical protein